VASEGEITCYATSCDVPPVLLNCVISTLLYNYAYFDILSASEEFSLSKSRLSTLFHVGTPETPNFVFLATNHDNETDILSASKRSTW
jgi:hypothetical protein